MTDGHGLSTSDMAAAADRRTDAPPERDERDRADHETQQARDVPTQTAEEPAAQLFADEEHTGFRTRWTSIQSGFVDEPRNAVEEADALVASVMKRLAEVFAEERRHLEEHWEKSDRVSTEELRIAMRRYHSFFERLLAV